eukprot:gene17470-23774_t
MDETVDIIWGCAKSGYKHAGALDAACLKLHTSLPTMDTRSPVSQRMLWSLSQMREMHPLFSSACTAAASASPSQKINKTDLIAWLEQTTFLLEACARVGYRHDGLVEAASKLLLDREICQSLTASQVVQVATSLAVLGANYPVGLQLQFFAKRAGVCMPTYDGVTAAELGLAFSRLGYNSNSTLKQSIADVAKSRLEELRLKDPEHKLTSVMKEGTLQGMSQVLGEKASAKVDVPLGTLLGMTAAAMSNMGHIDLELMDLIAEETLSMPPSRLSVEDASHIAYAFVRLDLKQDKIRSLAADVVESSYPLGDITFDLSSGVVVSAISGMQAGAFGGLGATGGLEAPGGLGAPGTTAGLGATGGLGGTGGYGPYQSSIKPVPLDVVAKLPWALASSNVSRPNVFSAAEHSLACVLQSDKTLSGNETTSEAHGPLASLLYPSATSCVSITYAHPALLALNNYVHQAALADLALAFDRKPNAMHPNFVKSLLDVSVILWPPLSSPAKDDGLQTLPGASGQLRERWNPWQSRGKLPTHTEQALMLQEVEHLATLLGLATNHQAHGRHVEQLRRSLLQKTSDIQAFPRLQSQIMVMDMAVLYAKTLSNFNAFDAELMDAAWNTLMQQHQNHTTVRGLVPPVSVNTQVGADAGLNRSEFATGTGSTLSAVNNDTFVVHLETQKNKSTGKWLRKAFDLASSFVQLGNYRFGMLQALADSLPEGSSSIREFVSPESSIALLSSAADAGDLQGCDAFLKSAEDEILQWLNPPVGVFHASAFAKADPSYPLSLAPTQIHLCQLAEVLSKTGLTTSGRLTVALASHVLSHQEGLSFSDLATIFVSLDSLVCDLPTAEDMGAPAYMHCVLETLNGRVGREPPIAEAGSAGSNGSNLAAEQYTAISSMHDAVAVQLSGLYGVLSKELIQRIVDERLADPSLISSLLRATAPRRDCLQLADSAMWAALATASQFSVDVALDILHTLAQPLGAKFSVGRKLWQACTRTILEGAEDLKPQQIVAFLELNDNRNCKPNVLAAIERALCTMSRQGRILESGLIEAVGKLAVLKKQQSKQQRFPVSPKLLTALAASMGNQAPSPLNSTPGTTSRPNTGSELVPMVPCSVEFSWSQVIEHLLACERAAALSRPAVGRDDAAVTSSTMHLQDSSIVQRSGASGKEPDPLVIQWLKDNADGLNSDEIAQVCRCLKACGTSEPELHEKLAAATNVHGMSSTDRTTVIQALSAWSGSSPACLRQLASAAILSASQPQTTPYAFLSLDAKSLAHLFPSPAPLEGDFFSGVEPCWTSDVQNTLGLSLTKRLQVAHLVLKAWSASTAPFPQYALAQRVADAAEKLLTAGACLPYMEDQGSTERTTQDGDQQGAYIIARHLDFTKAFIYSNFSTNNDHKVEIALWGKLVLGLSRAGVCEPDLWDALLSRDCMKADALPMPVLLDILCGMAHVGYGNDSEWVLAASNRAAAEFQEGVANRSSPYQKAKLKGNRRRSDRLQLNNAPPQQSSNTQYWYQRKRKKEYGPKLVQHTAETLWAVSQLYKHASQIEGGARQASSDRREESKGGAGPSPLSAQHEPLVDSSLHLIASLKPGELDSLSVVRMLSALADVDAAILLGSGEGESFKGGSHGRREPQREPQVEPQASKRALKVALVEEESLKGAKPQGAQGAKAQGAQGAKPQGSQGAKPQGAQVAQGAKPQVAKAQGAQGAKAQGVEGAKGGKSEGESWQAGKGEYRQALAALSDALLWHLGRS